MNVVKYIKKNNEVEVKINEFKLCIFIFMCCGILGFFIEEIYDTLYNLKLDKNGFLYGLFLPIYAWGGVVIHLISKKIKNKPLFTFLIIILFAATFEYATGFILLKLWNKRFWDYSNYFLNLNGHICLFSVVAFGAIGILYIYIFEPLIKKIINKLGNRKVDIYIKCFLIIYLIDNIFSFLVKNKL